MYLLVVGGAGPGQNYVSETFITPGSRTRGDDGGQLTLFSLCCSPFGAPETLRIISADHILHARTYVYATIKGIASTLFS